MEWDRVNFSHTQRFCLKFGFSYPASRVVDELHRQHIKRALEALETTKIRKLTPKHPKPNPKSITFA
jgi:hypothetical protein